MKAIEIADEGRAEILEKHVHLGYSKPGVRYGCDYICVVEGSGVSGNLSDKEAATLDVSITTVGQELYKSLKLPVLTGPAAEPYPILTHGGSTVTGLLGIQFAKTSRLRVVATCSPGKSDYPRSLGADIRALTDNALTVAWDCTGHGRGPVRARARGRPVEDPRQGAMVPADEEALCRENPNVRVPPLFTLGYEIFSERCAFSWGKSPPKRDESEFTKALWETSRGLLARGLIRTVDPVVNRGGAGLEDVLVGLEELRNCGVSAGKLVYAL
ncbi:hypothetical protein DL765_005067 [Monosporascus sp. GIB2]|nr:hypothetical protein DL765_005067 [Monosporascus sp. GIB2]